MTPATGHSLAIYARSLRPCSGSARIVLGLTRALVDDGHAVHLYGRRIDRDGIRDAGGTPHRDWLDVLPRRASGWFRGFGRRAPRPALTARHDAMIGDGEIETQDALLLHNVVRSEAEMLGEAAGPHYTRMIAHQEHILRNHRFGLLVANSNLMASEVVARYGVPTDDIVVLHPGVDTRRFAPDPLARQRLRELLGLRPDQLLAGYITSGNFALRGIGTLTETVAALQADHGDRLRVLAVCNQRNEALLRQAFHQQGCGTQLICLPKTHHIETYLQALDLLLHPAHFETFGLVVSEAAACGCPVVTSERSGAAELFSGRAREPVAHLPQAAALVPRVRRLLEDPSYRSAVASEQAAQARAVTWQGYARSLLDALARRGRLRRADIRRAPA